MTRRRSAQEGPGPGGVRSTPYGRPVQQSDHAPPMTRRQSAQEGPTPGGHPSPLTVHPFCSPHTKAVSRSFRTRADEPDRRTHPGGAQHNPPCSGRELARHRRRKHPHQARRGSTFARFPSGCHPDLPGTPGTNRQNACNPLSSLVFSVPGRTGNKHKPTGNTGNNLMQGSAQRCGACVVSRSGAAVAALGKGCRGGARCSESLPISQRTSARTVAGRSRVRAGWCGLAAGGRVPPGPAPCAPWSGVWCPQRRQTQRER